MTCILLEEKHLAGFLSRSVGDQSILEANLVDVIYIVRLAIELPHQENPSKSAIGSKAVDYIQSNDTFSFQVRYLKLSR